jgi:integrase
MREKHFGKDVWLSRKGAIDAGEGVPGLIPGSMSAASYVVVGRHFRSAEVDIPKGSIHRARHSFGTDLLRRGGDLREVQTLMRHSSPATTAIYTAVDEDRLRATINRLGRSA